MSDRYAGMLESGVVEASLEDVHMVFDVLRSGMYNNCVRCTSAGYAHSD